MLRAYEGSGISATVLENLHSSAGRIIDSPSAACRI
jgi:hypothetical protein